MTLDPGLVMAAIVLILIAIGCCALAMPPLSSPSSDTSDRDESGH